MYAINIERDQLVTWSQHKQLHARNQYSVENVIRRGLVGDYGKW